MALEPHQISAEEVPDFVKAHLHHATAYNPSIASEEDPTLEVINTIGIIDSHLHYQGTANRHKGQMHVSILILLEIIVILIIIIVASIILFIPLEMSIIPVIVK